MDDLATAAEELTTAGEAAQWFARHGIRPHVVAEFEDSALFKVFGSDGVGIFAAPTAVEDEVIRQYGVKLIGRTDDVRERFYAISLERKITHPAIAAIRENARLALFADTPDPAARDDARS